MIDGVEMVTDRTIFDVNRVKFLVGVGFSNMTDIEKQEFLGGLKGAYNYTDFNRVEGAVEYLSKRLVDVTDELKVIANDLSVYWNENAFGVPYSPSDYLEVKIKKDWTFSDRLTENERTRYIQNILLVLKSFSISDPNIPTKIDGLNYIGANAIEECLIHLNETLTDFYEKKIEIIEGVSKNWYHSGEIQCGEV